ncbi:hypothetical protein LXL04_018177 [Taraxacum kok-saghyz]
MAEMQKFCSVFRCKANDSYKGRSSCQGGLSAHGCRCLQLCKNGGRRRSREGHLTVSCVCNHGRCLQERRKEEKPCAMMKIEGVKMKAEAENRTLALTSLWEVMGSSPSPGMMHPRVLPSCGVSQEKVGSSLGKNQSGEIKEGGKGGDSRLPGKSGPVSNVPESSVRLLVIVHKTPIKWCLQAFQKPVAYDPSSSSSSSSPTSTSTPTTTEENKEAVVDMMKIKDMANTLDIRVGKILKAWRHEEADSLYVEEVDIGEPEPRIICSGLVKYIPLEQLQNKNVIVLANLKPRNMRGVKSFGMLMAASDKSHENVELLEPPEGVELGERIWFGIGGEDEKEKLPEAASANQVAKKKIWEQVQPHLSTTGSCVATLGGTHLMLTSCGSVVSKSLSNANIS